MLLDPIVVSHQIACQWEGAADEEKERMILVAEDCVRRFVSMAQREVGRSRTAHAASMIKGEGENARDAAGQGQAGAARGAQGQRPFVALVFRLGSKQQREALRRAPYRWRAWPWPRRSRG